MENNEQKVKEKKGSTGFLVFIIVLLLIIIGVGVGWYLGSNGKDKKQENTTNTTNTTNTANTTVTTNNKEMTADERYAAYSKGVQAEIEKMGKDITEEMRKDISNPVRLNVNTHTTNEFPVGDVYLNDKKEVYIAIKETGDEIKLFENAINCGFCAAGNGGTLYVIWAVDVNGDLYIQDYDTMDTANRMNFKLTKKQGFKNVLAVVQCSGVSAVYPIVVDIDGNVYNL